MVHISSGYFMSQNRRVTAALGEDSKWVTLSMPHDCELLLVLLPERTGREHVLQLSGHLPSQAV